MSTELYPYDLFGDASKYDRDQDCQNEKVWLVNEIVRPNLPNIIDNVERCVEILYSDEIFKMPISNNTGANNKINIKDSAVLKGIITRQGTNILDFQMMLSFPEFRQGKQMIYKMDTTKKFPLVQLEEIGEYLEQSLQLLEDLEVEDNIPQFINKFDKVLKLIAKSICLLQNPPKSLMFPFNNNSIFKTFFPHCEDGISSSHHEISLELSLFKNELCVDLRNLNKVTKKPWCNIDPSTGQSVVDKIKETLTHERSKKLNDILKEHNINIEESSLFNNLIISTFNKDSTTLEQAQSFIARCVTFDNKVVTEIDKLSITTSDPNLITITSKLNALEYAISNHFTNLEV